MIINTERLITKHGELQVEETLQSLQHALILAYEMGRDTDSLRSDIVFIRELGRTQVGDPSALITLARSYLLNPKQIQHDYYDRSEMICGVI